MEQKIMIVVILVIIDLRGTYFILHIRFVNAWSTQEYVYIEQDIFEDAANFVLLSIHINDEKQSCCIDTARFFLEKIFAVAWQVQAQVNCTATGAGRFANDDDTTCKNYTLCVYDSSTGTYLSYDYVCPTTSVFNPNTAMCTASTNYVCNVTTTNSTNTTSVCTADGYIADPDSTNCTTYIECVEINSTYTETTYTCPDDTYFDPNTTLCESNYTCTTNSSSSSNTTTTFTCTAAGRFANSADTTCQTYYYCVLASNGTYLEYEYTCPTTSVFSPTAKVCTTSYTCSS